MTRIMLTASATLLVALTLVMAANCDRAAPTAAPAPSTQPAVAGAAAAGAMDWRGLAVQVQSGYRPLERYTPLFDEIVELGANTVLLSAAGFMEHAESQQIYIEARKTPSRHEFKQLVRAARERDLRVILMPIILLTKPRGNEWRGVIKPPDWDAWWDEYREFIIYFCEIAREGEADALIVGSELVSTERKTERWERIIATAREHFYGGKLGYSANWDHYKPVEFWDELDFVGMTTYYTLADEKNPSVAEIMRRWEPIYDEVMAWREGVNKPIVFTEVGWCSQEGAATAPWNYYQNQTATTAGLEEQRRLYEAFIRVWSGAPGIKGVIWWDWSLDGGGATDFGYTPRNKPAERVLRRWFASFSDEGVGDGGSDGAASRVPTTAPGPGAP